MQLSWTLVGFSSPNPHTNSDWCEGLVPLTGSSLIPSCAASSQYMNLCIAAVILPVLLPRSWTLMGLASPKHAKGAS